MTSIKLLALDLDGTLVDSKGRIPSANLDAIRAAERAGVLVTVATGRRYRDAYPVAIEAGLNAPILTHNGALTKSLEDDRAIHFDLIPSDVAAEIVDKGSFAGGDALVSANPHGKGTMFYESISGDNAPLRKYVEWATRLHGDEAEESVVRVPKLLPLLHKEEIIHISFSGRCGAMQALAELLTEELESKVNILSTIYPHLDFTLVDILPEGSSKATGLSKLCHDLDIESSSVMAIGDNFNDLEMLEFAGLSVVMGNADKELLSREEFYTTVSNEEAGVAAAVRRFILET